MLMSRRRVLLAAGTMLVLPIMRSASAQTPPPPGPFTLPPLTYGFDALEPHIDAQTMMIHHDRHHAAYVGNLNTMLKDHGQVAAMPLQTILARLGEMPETIRTALRNNGGGHANHTMFWQIMATPTPANAGPTAQLAAAIDRDLGGLDAMKLAFNRAGVGQFGSGWVFVTTTKDGKLALVTRPNQDAPLMDGGMVLFGNDVWEHAYYLKYQNRRADYLAAWWNLVDWTKVAARYAAAQAGTLTL